MTAFVIVLFSAAVGQDASQSTNPLNKATACREEDGQDFECICGMCEVEIKEGEFTGQEYQRKSDRDAMLDGQLDEKLEEVEVLRKKLRETQ
ncbi:hypothetical protein PV05_04357 [Exophiala xenobiotica]|uniref:Uncharacterized protein n=1 Tax=Exophiala xenobiotica TaxID=348802 RepID=A0A0D2BT21_9EURO|nr:uncharacterized protein PV05_04357 [Exophiala xenobiotica]KIW55626.1 hypothetical protein PV05_04357 [Exophiala xenobiotica]